MKNRLKSFNYLTIVLGIIFISTFLLVVSCDSNNFNLKTTIEPKLTKVSAHSIAVEYYLGDLLVLDEWKDLNAAQVLFLMDPTKKKTVTLNFSQMGDSAVGTVFFHYQIESIEISTENPIPINIIFENVNSFPGVAWNIKDDKTISNQSSDDKPVDTPKKEKKDSINKKI